MKEKQIMIGAGGKLDIIVMKNPFGEWQSSKGDHYTELAIEPWEWEHLFFEVLQVPQREIYADNENIHDYERRQKRLFQEYLRNKGYEMLSRIWHLHQDANFSPSEVSKLLKECLEVQNRTNNRSALSALKKVIVGCREAIKISSGLSLASD